MNRTRRNSKRRSSRSRKRGGMAPVNYSTVSANPQPSENVMQWSTTAGYPRPSAAEMRNVAHGGRRRTKRSGKRRGSKRTHCRRRSRR